MKKLPLITLLFIIIFFGGMILHFNRPRAHSEHLPVQITQALKAVQPNADRFSSKEGQPPHFKAYRINSQTHQEELIGLAFFTTDLAPGVVGYSGPVHLMVGVDLKGTVTDIFLLSHTETSSYTSKLHDFLKQFQGCSSHDTFVLGKDIDGITGATITSGAATKSIQQSLRRATEKILS